VKLEDTEIVKLEETELEDTHDRILPENHVYATLSIILPRRYNLNNLLILSSDTLGFLPAPVWSYKVIC
jgi:hypothetical protein